MTQISKEQCDKLDLDYHSIIRHQEKIKKQLIENTPIQIPILDTCRKDNSGVLDTKDLTLPADSQSLNIAAFIPAAGASSRFIGPFGSLIKALKDKRTDILRQEFETLFSREEAKKWFLFPEIKALVNLPEKIENLSDDQMKKLAHLLSRPKALFPCTSDSKSFFNVKVLEHQKLPQINKEVYVVPIDRIPDFKQDMDDTDQIHYLEQGPELSSIRFDKNAKPITDDQGNYSMVPAGHGALAKLFPKAYKLCKEPDAFFIRNSDNICGIKQDAIQATEHFFSSYQLLFSTIKTIRAQLTEQQVAAAEHTAKELLHACNLLEDHDTKNYLQRVQEKLFHTPQNLIEETKAEHFLPLYLRPFNMLGVVPNSGKDVGGTPVFSNINGIKTKVCIEVPHASPEDKEQYLHDPNKATHFNPVFVLAEANVDPSIYEKSDLPFWLMAKKQWQGQDAYYFETILYEILGNSIYANLVFAEIPRILFNPNKSLNDCVANANLLKEI